MQEGSSTGGAGILRLLILNLSMDKSHPALAHQFDVANALARHFSQVAVITREECNTTDELEANVSITSFKKTKSYRATDVFRFYKCLLVVLLRFRPDVVFSHMSASLSALASPITALIKTPHYLWYAHTKNNFSLQVSHKFGCEFISSTSGSFPVNRYRPSIIGQGVDPTPFTCDIGTNELGAVTKFVHIGRVDPSKNIDAIIEVVAKLRSLGQPATLNVVGSPIRNESLSYADQLAARWEKGTREGWLRFTPSISKDEVGQTLKLHHVFLHAYEGSLDKVLVEAAMSGIHIATLNQEYHVAFKTKYATNTTPLLDQVHDILKMKPSDRKFELERIRKIALEEHSLDPWIEKIITILMHGAQSPPA